MTDKVIEKWKQKIRNMKKEDYLVLLLAGVLLLIISLPTDRGEHGNGMLGMFGKESGQEGGDTKDFPMQAEQKITDDMRGGTSETTETTAPENNGSYILDTYVANLEKRVEEIVSAMEGAGRVKVMITVSDTGTMVLEQNRETAESNLEETDNAGGSRKSTENSRQEETVYKKDADGNEIPYVVQRKLPEITGVVVTAEGAGNSKVKENIIGAVGVLFNLNEHRIKVIRMKS